MRARRASVAAPLLSVALLLGCERRDAPGEPVSKPVDLALRDAGPGASPSSSGPVGSDVLSDRPSLCRDGTLFDGDGNPGLQRSGAGGWNFEVVGGFGTLAPGDRSPRRRA